MKPQKIAKQIAPKWLHVIVESRDYISIIILMTSAFSPIKRIRNHEILYFSENGKGMSGQGANHHQQHSGGSHLIENALRGAGVHQALPPLSSYYPSHHHQPQQNQHGDPSGSALSRQVVAK